MRRLLTLLAGLTISLIVATPSAAAPAFPSVIPLPDGFEPEGIAIEGGGTFYVGSIPTGAIYTGSLRTGAGEILVEEQPGRAAIGLAVDDRNRLFVAGGPTGDAYVYDADTGAQLAVYDFAADDTFVNDVVVTKHAAWFTDSFQPVLYRVPISPNGTLATPGDTETHTLSGDYDHVPGPGNFNLNGIDATPSGDTLVVVQSATGRLFTVDPGDGETREIELADGESVPAGDGILLDGKRLYVVQNQLNQVARVDLAPDFASGTVVSRSASPHFDVPTTAAEFGNALYLVNARFGLADPEDAEFWMTRLRKP